MKPQKIISRTGHIPALKLLDRHLKSKQYSGSHFFILGDKNIIEYCMPTLVAEVEALQEAVFFEVECGETSKNLAMAEDLWRSLLDSGADRDAVIVNLGGGTISDLGGFVAAAYKRGIRYLNVPTTLLAMVDAAIGGKTAVNVDGMKNQVGFFHLPPGVFIEPQFLNTLPQREMLSGVFEMLKTFAVADKECYKHFLELLSDNHLDVEERLIYRCAEIKADIVSRDLMDHGERKKLNFGHTFGHAIESLSLKQAPLPPTHGEAVGLGMVCALWLSAEKFGLNKRICKALSDIVLPLVGKQNYTGQQVDELVAFMSADKKNSNGEVRCVLLKDIGEAIWDVPICKDEIRDAFSRI